MYPKLVMFEASSSGAGRSIPRVPLAEGDRNEAWLRDFLLAHPEALPCQEVDPAFGTPIPLCSELRTNAGPIDAVFIDRNGTLAVVECKLWRNPQARREVIGQILDYARELARWRYEDLQREVSRRRSRTGNVIYELVREANPDLVESDFVDSTSKNLAKGRFLLLIAGDGIREGTEAIATYLQAQPGLQFTFGLVEMAGYELPSSGGNTPSLLVQPRVLAKTIPIERATIRIEGDGRAIIDLDGAEDDERIEASEEGPARLLDPEIKRSDEAFWKAFQKRFTSDDPTQLGPKRSGIGWSRLEFIPGKARLTIYRHRGLQTVGVYLLLSGQEGLAMYASLEEDRSAIDDEIREVLGPVKVKWTADERSAGIAVSDAAPLPWDQQANEKHITALTRITNTFVNVFRPRLLRLSERR